ncbi:MAG: hypothetical protein HC942_16100 [Microcoleus sp. SU_5_6]|nr:hypothetical protein [Microcoleus sp. SU_5_6]
MYLNLMSAIDRGRARFCELLLCELRRSRTRNWDATGLVLSLHTVFYLRSQQSLNFRNIFGTESDFNFNFLFPIPQQQNVICA